LDALQRLVTAPMRGWHLHFPALTLHHAAAGALLSVHLRVRSHAGHYWGHAGDEQQRNRSELAKPLHTITIPSPTSSLQQGEPLDPVGTYAVESGDMKSLTIGQLAQDGGINPESVRLYEAQGPLPEPPRSMAGYRMYPLSAVLRIRFIKKAQDLGFSLKEIKELLSSAEDRLGDRTKHWGGADP
jgi:hypothetical protein